MATCCLLLASEAGAWPAAAAARTAAVAARSATDYFSNGVGVVRVQVLRTSDPHNRYWCLVPVSASPARKRTIT